MIIDTITRKLQAVMAGAASTTNPSFVLSFNEYDQNGSVVNRGTILGDLTGTTAKDILPAIGGQSGNPTRRKVASMAVYNKDTAAVDLTIQVLDGSTVYPVFAVTLQTLETLCFAGTKWYVLTSAGAIKHSGAMMSEQVDLNGATDALIFDADGDTGMDSPTDDYLVLKVGGIDIMAFTPEGFERLSGAMDNSHQNRVTVMEDFLADAGVTLPKPWGKQDTSAAGSPTTDYVADAIDGHYTLTHDTQSEAQTLTLYWVDQLMIDPTKKPIFEAKLKINFAGAAFTADQRIVIGLASARNATLDSIVSNAWFRIEGANLNILAETDDGTLDDDDNDTTIDIVDNTFITLRIDMSDLDAVKFYVDGVLGATLDAGALSASNLLQPFIEIQRDAGAEAEAVTIDYVKVEWDRAA